MFLALLLTVTLITLHSTVPFREIGLLAFFIRPPSFYVSFTESVSIVDRGDREKTDEITTKRHLLACLHRQFNEPVGRGDSLLEDEDMRNDNSARFAILVGTFCNFLPDFYKFSTCFEVLFVLPRYLCRSVCVSILCVSRGCARVSFCTSLCVRNSCATLEI